MKFAITTAATALLCIAPASAAMRLGVNTHFDQSWPAAALSQVKSAEAESLRDTLVWSKIERNKGLYNFNVPVVDLFKRACGSGTSLTLDISPQNPLYDGGMTVYTPAATVAFAHYIGAVSRAIPCLKAVEIGNEINGAGGIKGPARQLMPGSYIAILRAVHDELQNEHSHLMIIGGSTNLIPTGFLTKLFKAGMLPLVDGVAIHPYSESPEFSILELARLRSAMKAAGSVKPIWATEFGLYYPTPEMAPPHALKMMTILSANGVEEADWYALLDEPWFPNMGLYKGTTPKPALDTFRAVIETLLRSGDAKRIDTNDPLSFIYKFGQSSYVVWGHGRDIRFTGRPRFFSARGQLRDKVDSLGSDPIIVADASGFELGPTKVVAASLGGYGVTWSYWTSDRSEHLTPLGWIDWAWTSYFGSTPGEPPMVLPGAIRPGDNRVIERYTPEQSGPLFIDGAFCQDRGSEGASLTIKNGNLQFYHAVISSVNQFHPLSVSGIAKQPIDFEYSGSKSTVIRRDIRISRSGLGQQPACLAKKM